MRFTTLAALSLSSSLVACTDDVVPPPPPPLPQPEMLALPGDAFYPESLTADADGTLYVGSLGTGQVVAFDDGSETPRTVVAGHGVTNIAGVAVHDDALWLCAVDFTFQRPTELRRFTLEGAPAGTYPLAANQFCNDIGFDEAGNVYATDSFSGTVLRLRPGATALETWKQSATWQPSSQGAFGLDGIALGDGGIYLNVLDTGKLFHVAIDDASGAAGTPREIVVSPPLVAPDGMRVIDEDTLLVIEGSGKLTQVEITGSTAIATPIAAQLDMPTSVVVARGSAWVTEGQLGRLLAQPPVAPKVPFLVRRIDL